MDLITFLAHLPTYPFTVCEHIMPALKAMCELNMGCYEEWGDWFTCPKCNLVCHYCITEHEVGNISIDHVEINQQTYYLYSEPTPTMPPIYRLKPNPTLRCREDHHNA